MCIPHILGTLRGGLLVARGRSGGRLRRRAGVHVGFYAFFAPVSYSADADPSSAGFDEHLGYEAGLLTALAAMNGAGLSFARQSSGFS